MTTKLDNYMDDGAGRQARGVLAFLQGNTIESSWNNEMRKYMAEPEVARWENCREQGYIVSMRGQGFGRQINIAFFEHRNSDQICAIMWEQVSINSITIDTADFGDAYQDKYGVSHSVGYGEASKMAGWIWDQLEIFWESTKLV